MALWVSSMPCGGAGRAGADALGQPVGLCGGETGGGSVDVDAGGSLVDVPVGRSDAVVDEHGVPAFDPRPGRGDHTVQRRSRLDGQAPRLDVPVHDLHFVPAHVALRFAAVGGDEEDPEGSGGVVEGDDGPDVVSVEALDGLADGGMGRGVHGALESGAGDGGVDAGDRVGTVLDLAGVGGSGFQGGKVVGDGGGGDEFGVGVAGEREELGP
jgi:hypothetical protein